LDLDLAELPPTIEVPVSYDQAFVLIRWHRTPVGQIWLTVDDGRLVCTDLRATLTQAAGSPLRERLLDDFLGPRSDTLAPVAASVAICTRDRTQDLKRCLDALMDMPNDGQEVLVIDNCPSSDATAQLVRSYSTVRYFRNERPGLNRARNRALREARHSIVAFIDDDAVPDPGWLRGLVDCFDDAMVLCATGLTIPLVLETKAQEWHEYYSSFGRGFQRRVFEASWISPMASGHAGAGVNMAVRRDVAEMLGEFDEALDAGTPTRSGGDNEMFSRILAAGYRITYNPEALASHRHRSTWAELRRATFGYGAGVYAAWTRSVLYEREFGAVTVALSWFSKQLRTLVRSILRRPGSPPIDLLALELCGCFAGPWVYWASCRAARRWRDRM
jgi:GT2 family glycosyltransferase